MLRDLTEPNMIEQSLSIYLGSKPIPIYLLLLMLVFCQNYCFCYYSVNFFLYICYLSRTEKNKLKTFIDIHNTFSMVTGFMNYDQQTIQAKRYIDEISLFASICYREA